MYIITKQLYIELKMDWKSSLCWETIPGGMGLYPAFCKQEEMVNSEDKREKSHIVILTKWNIRNIRKYTRG